MTSVAQNNQSIDALGKYAKWNTLLFVLLIYKAYTQLFPYHFFLNQLLLQAEYLFPVLMNGIIIYLVVSKKIKFYLWAGLFFIAVIIYVLIREIFMDYEQNFFHPIYNFYHTAIVLNILLNLTCCILFFWLKARVLPRKTKKAEESGSDNYRDNLRSDYDDDHPLGDFGLDEDSRFK